MSTKLQELTKRYEDFKTQQREAVEEAIQSVFKDIQQETPEVKSFVFGGYIPYFNDGEACVFSITEPWYGTTETVVESPYEDETQVKSSKTTSLMENLRGFIYQQSDMIEDIYGSNFVATLTANKTTCLEYTDHD